MLKDNTIIFIFFFIIFSTFMIPRKPDVGAGSDVIPEMFQ